jgi:hypothetical protein
MITEDYVSFETAKLLKEKGFDERCFAFYYIMPHKTAITYNTDFPTNSDLELIYKYKEFGSLPTLQMAMKWLREVHKCYITFTWEFKEYDNNYKPIYKDITWSFNIAIPKYNSARKGDGSYFDLDSDKEYDSYEQACEVALKYCLENLI